VTVRRWASDDESKKGEAERVRRADKQTCFDGEER
jgi:hypothetical protein